MRVAKEWVSTEPTYIGGAATQGFGSGQKLSKQDALQALV